MKFTKIEDMSNAPYTALLYCAPGVGKSTAIGLIAERNPKKTLVLDIDRTIERTLAKGEVVVDTSRVLINQIDNINTFESWTAALVEIDGMVKSGELAKMGIDTIAVDNISELERCILSDLGSKGKNKGVPAMADYQSMQFKLVNSLRFMKSWGLNIIWTAWEITEPFTHPDGTQYSRLYPKISTKIVDNICGLCDVVGRIMVNREGRHGIILSATQNIYAKNQIDSRKGCLVEEFLDFNKGMKGDMKDGDEQG